MAGRRLCDPLRPVNCSMAGVLWHSMQYPAVASRAATQGAGSACLLLVRRMLAVGRDLVGVYPQQPTLICFQLKMKSTHAFARLFSLLVLPRRRLVEYSSTGGTPVAHFTLAWKFLQQ